MPNSHNRSAKILITIPHYCNRDADHINKKKEMRSMSFVRSVSSLVQQFSHSQMYFDFKEHTASPANQAQDRQCDIYICTSGADHLLNELDIIKGLYHHVESDAHPRLLGFACREILKAFAGKYDYFCYMEDDLFINDPLFFHKLAWFTENAGDHCLLQPNRCEVSFHQQAKKCYIDGEIADEGNPYFNPLLKPLHFNALGVEMRFRPATNPHSGCFFLNARQFDYWAQQPHFASWDMSWVGPLESAASLGIMKTFRIYKPDWNNANFLEISHFGDAYLQTIGDDFTINTDLQHKAIRPEQHTMVSSISTASCPSLVIDPN